MRLKVLLRVTRMLATHRHFLGLVFLLTFLFSHVYRCIVVMSGCGCVTGCMRDVRGMVEVLHSYMLDVRGLGGDQIVICNQLLLV